MYIQKYFISIFTEKQSLLFIHNKKKVAKARAQLSSLCESILILTSPLQELLTPFKIKSYLSNYTCTKKVGGITVKLSSNHCGIRLSNLILAYRESSASRDLMLPNSVEVKVSIAMGNWFLRDCRLGKVFFIPVWPHERVRADNTVHTEFKFEAIQSSGKVCQLCPALVVIRQVLANTALLWQQSTQRPFIDH